MSTSSPLTRPDAAPTRYFAGDGEHDHRLILAYYVAAVGVLSLYGIRVCPFIAGLDALAVIATFLVAFTAAFGLKLALEPRLMPAGEPFTLSIYQFAIDLALFTAVGVGISLYNHHIHGFPLESGGKVLIGCMMFGIFAGLDNGLRRERRTPSPLDRITETPRKIFPITDRLFVIFVCVGIFTGAVSGLVIVKDIDYLIAHIDDEPHAKLRRAIFIDIAFVIGTVLVLAMRLLWSYGNNLAYILRLQIDGLAHVSEGRLDTFVPIITRDEFSLIAAKTNRMIASLRDAHREQDELFAVSQALATELRLDPLLTLIVATTRGFVGADRVSLFLHDAERDELWGRVAEGSAEPIRFAADRGIAGECFRSQQPVRIDDAYADPRFNPEFDRRSGYTTRSLLCVPVEDRDGRCIGVIQAINKLGGRFDVNDERRLRAFAAQAAIALVNAQLFADLARAQRYSESILRSLTNGVVTLNPQGQIVTANAAAQALLGLDGSDQGSDFVECMGTGNDWLISAREAGREHYLGEVELIRRDGSTRQAVTSRVPLADPDGRALGTMLVFDDVTEEKRVRNTLSRYLAPQVAEQMLANADLNLGGVDQRATVLFSDIRDFTTISEQLGARDTVAMLNEYFSQMVEAISAEHGILDKFIGDAVMALFGVPFPGEDDADHAVRAALSMQERLVELNARRAERGEAPLAIGIGLSTGELVAGNVGSPKRMDYTVIGDTVNLSARLESATKTYGVSILLSDATKQALRGDYPLRELDRVRVKGKQQAAVIHQLMLPAEQLAPAALEQYSGARERYLSGEWAEAAALLEDLCRAHPEDGPSATLLRRCRRLAEQAPAYWDGAWPPPENG
ncbi:adenylate/guanylate cyclase domain-containing protein [Pseudomarimonas salicorniae]|uniref:GAF domain-containing protein n=1 Tax=Pseudomarimonas salicorniae TaxID=2933270 RepID=A0ABT0GKW6_9GAMM|nr:adenylate/guanylate cyclase domain-containing protein [Lysobacter sp. CAU 1642]MCK7595022.1 GAF domain-containing protein [Lysobacter sp. CAU 1642]